MNTASTSSPRVAIVAAQWHADIVDRAVDSCERRLGDHGITDVEIHRVPGAFEIPLLVRRLALSGRYGAVATVALVVDGGIYRHEFVAVTVVDALMRVQLETDVPVFSGVLTPHHFHEHEEHRGQFSRHFVTKGEELADAVSSTLTALAGVSRDTGAEDAGAPTPG
ncbi:6,7-dimethyl-8-ribityllumazine synthase [Kocuria rosea]|uniref:6,7-dimethyl-8-ribityllumazine synthase n=1 Tax=Kocuria rosea TaxID=1275 RepID=A0A4R5Y698_KOCRO|nr:6,7-dimethyl-8-ribityllumazine synthase [Kocuria rosea]TDL40141.1 6,7-dimethyl-8-ribityllumazine synthase [Kocuria rosea]